MFTVLLLGATLASCVAAAPPPAQVPLGHPPSPDNDFDRAAPRKLHGRFLHITDMHPDPHYSVGATVASACHRPQKTKKKGKGDDEPRAGTYGVPFSECDSPFTLTNYTLKYLENHWADKVDFVIWTGDSARHDNDRLIPRTLAEIFDLNRAMARRMEEIFTSRGVPVIPSLGNNDVWPHNILAPGPNSITNEFTNIWQSFIPFSSFQVFQRGAYYSVEVVPDELAVISLNTMYFYDSNKAVGGCEYSDPEDPGNLQFDWLEVQLDLYRDRGMQVWISGHVPPSPGNYFAGCVSAIQRLATGSEIHFAKHVRYADLALRFQDTIVGHLYGHMNVDHFFFIEKSDLVLPRGGEVGTAGGGSGEETLLDTLLRDFGLLPKKSKTDEDEFAVVNVGPSVVPNPYVPTFRVFTFNVTGWGGGAEGGVQKKKKKKKGGSKRKHGHRRPGEPEVDCEKKENRKRWECRGKKPWHSDEEAPSRRNQLWTGLGYAQYWLPDVGAANATHEAEFKLEYVTGEEEGGGRHAPYGLRDLTVGSWLKLGRRLGDEREGKLRGRFRDHMYKGGEEV